jgi:hypothetical protein
MRKSRFTGSPSHGSIVAILEEGETGAGLSELAKKHGISGALFV